MSIPMMKMGMSSLKVEISSIDMRVKNIADAVRMVAFLREMAKSNPCIKVRYNPGLPEAASIEVMNVPGFRVLEVENCVRELEQSGVEVTPDHAGRKEITKVLTKVVGATFMFCDSLFPILRKTVDKDGYDAVLMGFGKNKLKSWNKAQHGLFKAMDFSPKSIHETRCSTVLDSIKIDAPIDVSSIIYAGSYIDVSGTTIGRGFAGPIKRHNFSGLRATHGVSRAHRSHGSTGQRTQPGRVFKGKKMAGHYGNERNTVQSLRVLVSENFALSGKTGSVIGVLGAIPGYNGSTCFVSPSVKRRA